MLENIGDIRDAAEAVLDKLAADRSAARSPIISLSSVEEAAHFRALATPGAPRPVLAVIDDAAAIFERRVRMDHPRFYGFIPSPASPLSFIGEMLATGFNAHAGSWLQSSGPAAIEQGLIDWLAKRVGLPDTAGGLFVSGGSMANLTGLVLARDQKLPVARRQRGIAYISAQTHSSVAKGLGILGFLPDQIRKIPVDRHRRLDLVCLAAAIEADRRAGAAPFAVIASCGTTNTGSIDDLNAIGDLCAAEGLWLHVDGAYGASVALSKRHHGLASGLARADSLSWDAHKWLFQTYGCGMVLVRDRTHLVESFATSAEYLQDASSAFEAPNFWDYGMELTRPARAMKLWFTLQVMGVDALGEAIDHGFMLAETLEEALRARPDWEIVSSAQLGIVTFRFVPRGADPARLDELNAAISRRMIERNEGAPLTTRLEGKLVLRVCAISPSASADDIRDMAEAMDAAARDIARGEAGGTGGER